MCFERSLDEARLPCFSKKSILVTLKKQNWVIICLQKLTFGCFFLHFAPIWSGLGKTMAVGLRFGKPSIDYQ